MPSFMSSIAIRIISSVATAVILAGLFAWIKPNQARAARTSASS